MSEAAAMVMRLRDKIDELEETVLQLREQLRGPMLSPHLIQMRPQHRIILGMLLAYPGKIISPEQLALAINSKSEDPVRLVAVQIVLIRRFLVPYGAKINNEWGSGYWIRKEDADKLRQLLDRAA
ncbi:MAG: helix-turn-helix domain-containing protein [Hyphomicrobiales bacterium]|nr:helix-turn-helix domain-containing protein [Hyphomicrobiales bacterium]MDE2113838.1 helix-turn-helix domain-containing protein [Hyphomicrobiales bacterium]